MHLNINRLTGIASIVLGVGTAVSVILGPLVTNVIKFHVSDNARNQLIGGEIVSLCVVAPLAVAAGVLWLRGKRVAPMLALGPALYAIYTYVQFIIGPDYQRYIGNNEQAFPLYLSLILLSWVVVVRAWSELAEAVLPVPTTGLRRGLGSTLIVLGIFFALTWARSIADVLSGTHLTEYRQDPTLFWLIRLMDLGFVIPAALSIGVGLLRGKQWAVRMSYAITGFITLEIGAVAGMALAMIVRDDPAASMPLFIVTLVSALTLGAFFLRLLRTTRGVAAARRPAPLRATS